LIAIKIENIILIFFKLLNNDLSLKMIRKKIVHITLILVDVMYPGNNISHQNIICIVYIVYIMRSNRENGLKHVEIRT